MFLSNAFFTLATLATLFGVQAGLVKDFAIMAEMTPPPRVHLPQILLPDARPVSKKIPILAVLEWIAKIQIFSDMTKVYPLDELSEVDESVEEAKILCEKLQDVWGLERKPLYYPYRNGALRNNLMERNNILKAPVVGCVIGADLSFDVIPIYLDGNSDGYFLLAIYGFLLDLVASRKLEHAPHDRQIYTVREIYCDWKKTPIVNQLMDFAKGLTKTVILDIIVEGSSDGSYHHDSSSDITESTENESSGETSRCVKIKNVIAYISTIIAIIIFLSFLPIVIEGYLITRHLKFKL